MATQTMYADADPRSKLATAKASALPTSESGFGASSYVLFGQSPPQIDDANGKTWLVRGQNFIIAYTLAKPGSVFERQGQVDEYVLLIEAKEPTAMVTAGSEEVKVAAESLTIVPPGDSRITVPNGGEIVRLFTTTSKDLAELCANADTYRQQAPSIPPLQLWPAPPAGFKIRTYDLNVPRKEGRFGRIWRCTTFMVNVFEPAPSRDPNKLSPHFHDDFEQCSLAMGGTYVHHLRWPWTAKLSEWRDDEHVTCPAPSVAVIPPMALHTSAGMEPQGNLLVDIFSPPRRDFSDMEGWVLNADEYPAPPAA